MALKEKHGLVDSVEETLADMIKQVDKAMMESASKYEDSENEKENEPKTPRSTIRIMSTKSSKLRRKSARSRLEMYKDLAPERQQEIEIYAGKILRNEKKKKEKEKKHKKLEKEWEH